MLLVKSLKGHLKSNDNNNITHCFRNLLIHKYKKIQSGKLHVLECQAFSLAIRNEVDERDNVLTYEPNEVEEAQQLSHEPLAVFDLVASVPNEIRLVDPNSNWMIIYGTTIKRTCYINFQP